MGSSPGLSETIPDVTLFASRLLWSTPSQASMLILHREKRRGHFRRPVPLSFHDLSCSTRLRRPCEKGPALLPQGSFNGSSSSELESSPRGSKMSSGSPCRSEKPTSQRNHPHTFSSTPPNPLLFFFSANRVRPAIASRSYSPAPERDRLRPAANTRTIWTTGAMCQSERTAPWRERGSAKRRASAVLRSPLDRRPCPACPYRSSAAAEGCTWSASRWQMRRRHEWP